MELYQLEKIGFNRLDGFLIWLLFYTNLVQLELQYANISCDNVTLWCSTVRSLTSLLYLHFSFVSVSDSGMLSLCRGLLFHPTFRSLQILHCGLSSDSFFSFTNLVPTLNQLKYLEMNELSEPETEPIELLKLTADQYGIEHYLD